ncbi:hypothetical protein GGR55DRAFT_652276 [Xylaria sp. FL0064]|nr:hypothetical protein GGR55DRAFT_652276 [Xylaria sp. FL0064]
MCKNFGLLPSYFYETLLSSCCSNPRSLNLSHSNGNIYREAKTPLYFNMEFPKLTTHRIGAFESVDARVLSSLVREGLTSLAIEYNGAAQFPSGLGQIRTLDKLILCCRRRMSGSTPTRFIEANTQIRTLAVTQTEDAFLRRVVHSLRYHKSLKSLSLWWEEKDIPEASLDEISLLSSVEMLSIFMGGSEQWMDIWSVNHKKFERCIGCLSYLRCLIIRREREIYRFDLLSRWVCRGVPSEAHCLKKLPAMFRRARG